MIVIDGFDRVKDGRKHGSRCCDCGALLVDKDDPRDGETLVPISERRMYAVPRPAILDDYDGPSENKVTWVWDTLCRVCGEKARQGAHVGGGLRP